MPQLEIHQLSKNYGSGAAALKNFSLTVAENELVTIVGPSGCGKSTLLRLIAGLETPNAGTITLDGKNLLLLEPRHRNVAIVFQNFSLLPHLTVGENLAFGMKIRGENKAARIALATETATLLGIESLLHRYPSEISGGERQRTALGRAVLRKPDIFLFDEPLSSLDAQMRFQLRVEIQRLRKKISAPMLFVTHDQSEALTLGDRVVVLDHGYTQQISTPESLYASPSNTFVASFIGSPGMNLFLGKIVHESTPQFVSPPLKVPLTEKQLAKLSAYPSILVGLRPEALSLMNLENCILRGVLVAMEKQAGSTSFFLEHDSISFTVKLLGDRMSRLGETLGFGFSLESVVFFDSQTGKRIISE